MRAMQRWLAVMLCVLPMILVPSVRAAGTATGADAALIAAAEAGDAAQVKRLLASGVSVNARDARGRTALLAATHANRVEAARLLIEAGSDVNAQDTIQDSPFLYAGAEGRLEILKLILAGTRSRSDFKVVNRYGGNALIPACHHGHVETVRELLKTNIDVDFINNLGWSALLETVILGDGRIVIAAVKERGARGVCVDIDPQRIAEARENARKAGVAGRIEFLNQDLFKSDISSATVVMLYLWPHINLQLRPKLLADLKPGTRIVSHLHDMGDWKPERTVYVHVNARDRAIHFWTIPKR